MDEIHEIEVVITNEGRMSVEIRGLKGQGCLEITKDIEQLLGGEILERKLTYEYDQQATSVLERRRLKRGGP